MVNLMDYVSYDAKTGIFVWKVRASPVVKIGDRAGSFDGRYRGIHIAGKRYQEHRLAYFFVYGEWPQGQIDHINGDKLDNRIENLRVVNGFQNCQNRIEHIKGKSWGVHFVRGKWHASLRHEGKNHHIGVFNSEDEARGAVYGFLKGKNWLEHFGIL